MSDVQSDSPNETDRTDDAVDPRVQIELERLNTATDDINKLEVDLDEARATFRELLCESTMTIDALSKKLGSCIDKSRPYYDARFKAKEALIEAQKAAIRFERANGQHAAAKEMVYLAEEGLRMEGRSFDHAWQEMLNHATERVNESEHERAISETEHKRMTSLYHTAEHNVLRLQSELKRAIAKSSMGARRSLLLINSIAYRHNLLMLPYFEIKARFHQALEQQKVRVSELERSVAEAKMTYAEALRNLETISDEIHRTRNCDGREANNQTMTVTSSESSVTGSPDSTDYTSDEYLRLPDKMSPNKSCPTPTKLEHESSSEYLGLTNMSLTEPRKYIKREKPQSTTAVLSSEKKKTPLNETSKNLNDLSEQTSSTKAAANVKMDHSKESISKSSDSKDENNSRVNEKVYNGEEWTEISLNNSPNDLYYNNQVYSDDDDDDDDTIPYKPLPSELSPDSGHVPPVLVTGTKVLNHQQSLPVSRSPQTRCRGKFDGSLANWIAKSSAGQSGESNNRNSANCSRRQSLDILWGGGTGERMKELLSHGMMMLNISSLTERRSSEPRVIGKTCEPLQKSEKMELKGKKIPSPLEKTQSYLNPEEETSDSESLASVEMLTEDQISSLMMEPDINQVCQEVLGTPLVEVCPLLQQLQHQQYGNM